MTEESLVRITKVEITRLFGMYNHSFELHTEERITIIHGPNGVGKSILLKCIAALFNGHYSVLRTSPFRSFSVTLSDGSKITIHREQVENEGKAKGRGTEMAAEIRSPSGQKQSVTIKSAADIRKLARSIEQSSPYIVQIGEQTWMDRRTSRTYTAEELVENNAADIDPYRLERMREAEPNALTILRKRVKVSLIETDRLVRYPSENYEGPRASRQSTVNDYAKHLQLQIQQTLASYGRTAQQLDQTFPKRLLRNEFDEFSVDELKSRLDALEARQSELSELGLLDKVNDRFFDTTILDAASDSKLGAMSLYLLDSEKKIAAFDTVAERLKLLLHSARSKFRNKRLVVSREKGLQAIGDKASEILPLDGLSSGEQHEIVLMYELLFKTAKNTLILIDEPELSLHVSWQRMFLPELLSVCKTVGFDVILATHSPFIVGGHQHLMHGLDMDRDDMPGIDMTSGRRD